MPAPSAAVRHSAPAATAAARPPVGTASRSSTASSPLASARVSSVLSGKPLYRMSDGRIVELPDGMSAQEAAQLEAEARSAQQKLGKGPQPQPVPEVRAPADKREKTKAVVKPGGRSAAGASGKSVPRTAGVVATLKASGGKVAQYLIGKAAPVLGKGTAKLRLLSRNEQTHDNAATKRQQAEQAVVHPASENQSRSNASQVGMVDARPAPPVDPNAGKRQLQTSLAGNVPKTIEDVDNFKRDRKGQHIGADVLKVVQADKNAVVANFADMERTPPPAPPEQTPQPLPAPEAAPGTAPLNLGTDAVAPLRPEHTDVSAYTQQADARLKEEGLTQDQLDMVDSGDLATAKSEKKGMEAKAKSEPAAIQKFSQQQTQQVEVQLKQEEKLQRGALTLKRRNGLNGSAQKQKKAKSALEKQRDEVAARINGIHKTAQDKVKKQLADLETQSMKRFDDGNAAATKAFEDDVKKELDAFKADRYSGMFGWARKARDWLLGMEDLPGVKAIFDRNRARFVGTIDKLVADIGADNQRVIQDCKDQLARARQEIADYVAKLGPALKDIGNKTAGEVNRQLDEMDGFIRRKEEELQQKLADKQQAAIKAIDEKIEKMKEAMSGALSKLGKLLLWAAKKFFTWALSKFGYSLSEIESIISKGAAVLKAIFTKPIVFVKNLMNAAVTGFKNFGKNFLKHLKDALFEWLTGSLQGVTLPTSWDLKGIAGLALQMLGISYANIRRHMVVVMGEPVVAGLEKTFTLVKTLVTEGPMAAWEQLKEMAGAMRDAFVDAIKDFVKSKIIEEAVKWLAALFIPGAGIIKAVIGIYDTVVFFIQKAKQIAQMIGRFLGAIGEIAAGNIGAAAQAMEDGLARGLSLVINFLAALLRLNAVTARIRAAIQKVRGKVDEVLAKVAKWIAGKAGGLASRALGGNPAAPPRQRLEAATREAARAVDRLSGNSIGIAAIRPILALIRIRHGLRSLEAKEKGGLWAIVGVVNPTHEEMTKKLVDTTTKGATKREYGPINAAGFATSAKVTGLKKIGDPAPPSVSNTTWDTLLNRLNRKGGSTYYIAGHLINGTFGGPGNDWRNLTPLTQAANNRSIASMLHTFENPVRDAVNGRPAGTADISVTVNYGRRARNVDMESAKATLLPKARGKAIAALIEAEKAIPKSIEAKATITYGSGVQKKVSSTTDNEIDTTLGHYFHKDHPVASDPAARRAVNLNTASRDDLAELHGITDEIAGRIVRNRSPDRYKDRDDFIAKLGTSGTSIWHSMMSNAGVKLEF